MKSSEPGMPAALRARVFADLSPVRPLADPWKRALVLVPLALLLVAAVHMVFGTRADLGPALLWGMSALQVALGVVIAVASLREVIPDRTLPRAARIALFVAGFGLAVLVTYAAWTTSGTVAPAARRYVYWKSCLRYTVECGLPVLAVLLVLAARGVMWRPGLVGGLAGLAAGLIADASWRTFCSVAEPSHVLSSHFAGIVVLCAVGAVAAKIVAAFRR